LITLGWPNTLFAGCVGDINKDGKVNLLDLGIMNIEIGRSNCLTEPCQSDLNSDGAVNSDDREILRSQLVRNDCFRDGEEIERSSPVVFSDKVEEREGTVTAVPAENGFAAEEREGEITRFKNNGDGTVTDPETGLMWTKDANLPGETVLFYQALSFIEEMNRGNVPNFGYTDWRLPNLEELQSLKDFTRFTGIKKYILPEGHPFKHVQWLNYETYYQYPTYLWTTQLSWIVSFYCRLVGRNSGTCVGFVWPVRGGKID
jgi:hypothetical protein